MTINEDLAKVWSDGYRAGWEAGRLSWQLEDREHRGPIPQQLPCPYTITDVVDAVKAVRRWSHHSHARLQDTFVLDHPAWWHEEAGRLQARGPRKGKRRR